MSLDEIVAELDQEYTGIFPRQALREAQRRRKEMTPRLIELIRKGTEEVRAGNPLNRNGPLFALFLLAEFRAKEALPAITEAVSLPDEGPFELFGDAITESLGRILPTLAESPDVLDDLIANRSVDEYVRWKAAEAYLYFVADGRLSREEAVERLRGHLSRAIVDCDEEAPTGLVAGLASYAPLEALGEIQEAFRQELVERFVVDLDSVKRCISKGESYFQEELERCRPTGIQDTVDELSRWASFREDD